MKHKYKPILLTDVVKLELSKSIKDSHYQLTLETLSELKDFPQYYPGRPFIVEAGNSFQGYSKMTLSDMQIENQSVNADPKGITYITSMRVYKVLVEKIKK